MKCLVLIMSSNIEPSIRNVKAERNSFIKSYFENKNKFKHEFEFYSYVGDSNNSYIDEDSHTIYCNAKDDVYNSFEKTIEAFNLIKNKDFDFLIRINISTYINLFVLDNVLEKLNLDFIYCNKICVYLDSEKYLNKIFPRGDAYIIGKDRLLECLNNENIHKIKDEYDYTDKTDDVLFGCLLLETFGDDIMFKIKTLNYSFIPNTYIEHKDFYTSLITIFSRLKTVPPGSFAGYSWNDNEYRVYDAPKFHYLNNYIYNNLHIYDNYKYISFLLNIGNKEEYLYKVNNELKPISFNNLLKYHERH